MPTFWTGCSCFSRSYFCITTIPELSGWNLTNLLSWPCCYPLALAFIRCHTLDWKRGTAIIRCLLYNNLSGFSCFWIIFTDDFWRYGEPDNNLRIIFL
jgi:hypothetical protein